MTEPATVLIVSTDWMIGALVSAYVEREGFRAVVYDRRRGSASDAVERHQPELIIVDVDHPDGFSQAFVREQRVRGTQVVVFSPGRFADDVRIIAEQSTLPWFGMPIELDQLRRALATVN